MGMKLSLVAVEGDQLDHFAQIFEAFGLEEVEGSGGVGHDADVVSWVSSRDYQRNIIEVVGCLEGGWTTFYQSDGWMFRGRGRRQEIQGWILAEHLLQPELGPARRALVASLPKPGGYRAPHGSARGLLVAQCYDVEGTASFLLVHGDEERVIRMRGEQFVENRGTSAPEESAMDSTTPLGAENLTWLLQAFGIDLDNVYSEGSRLRVFKLFRVPRQPWWKFW